MSLSDETILALAQRSGVRFVAGFVDADTPALFRFAQACAKEAGTPHVVITSKLDGDDYTDELQGLLCRP